MHCSLLSAKDERELYRVTQGNKDTENKKTNEQEKTEITEPGRQDSGPPMDGLAVARFRNLRCLRYLLFLFLDSCPLA